MLIKKVYTSILALSTLISIPFAYASDNIYQKVDQSTICLETLKEDNKKAIGTAFFVAPGILAATAHQTRSATQFLVHYRPVGREVNRIYPAKLIAVNEENDLSILEIDFKNHPILPIGDSTNLDLGEEVFTIGCPLGLDHSLAKGFVSKSRRILKGKQYIQVDMGINHGNSGGPLVTKSGKVIGIIHGRLKQSEQIGFAVPTSLLLKLAKSTNHPVVSELEQDQVFASPNNTDSGDIQSRFISILKEKDVLLRIKKLSQFNRDYPEMAEPYYYLGVAYQQLKDYPNAIRFLQTTINKYPNFYKAYTNLALIYLKNKQYDKSREMVNKSLNLNQNYAQSYLILGLLYADADKNYPMATKTLQRYIQLEKNPQNIVIIQKLIQKLNQNSQEMQKSSTNVELKSEAENNQYSD